MYGAQPSSIVRNTTLGPTPVRQPRFHTPTVIVSNYCTSTSNVLSASGTTPTRVIMNNRLTSYTHHVPTTNSDTHSRASSGTYASGSGNYHHPRVVIADSSRSDHEFNKPIYISSQSNLVVRPTTVLSSQHSARSSSLSYATSQRTCDVPETMKLPTLRGLPSVSRQIMSNEPELPGCARVRVFSSNHRDKFSVDFNDDSRSYAADKRKRDFTQVNRVVKTDADFGTQSKDGRPHGGMFNDDESVVLRVDGDVKMVVDCDRESDSFPPAPKKNRPGRPRKYAEGSKPPRKEDDPGRKRRNRFKRRTQEEYQQVLEEINTKGLDAEDIGYLRTMFGRYQLDTTDDSNVPWGQRIPWQEILLPPNPSMFPQPARLVYGKAEPYFVDEELRDVVPNAGGCARTEPYSQYMLRTSVMAEVDSGFDENEFKSDDSRPFRKRVKNDKKVTEDSFFKTVQYPNSIKLKVAKISSSNSGHQQRCGVFAMETVEPNKVIVEFTGEVIRLDVARVREEKYWKLGFGVPPNIFKFDDEYAIDASREGNVARFVKHSCKPNCKTILKLINGLPRIFILSTTYIDKNEELSFDYNLSGTQPRVDCKCGARYCRGRL